MYYSIEFLICQEVFKNFLARVLPWARSPKGKSLGAVAFCLFSCSLEALPTDFLHGIGLTSATCACRLYGCLARLGFMTRGFWIFLSLLCFYYSTLYEICQGFSKKNFLKIVILSNLAFCSSRRVSLRPLTLCIIAYLVENVKCF